MTPQEIPADLGDMRLRASAKGSIMVYPSNKFIDPLKPDPDSIEILDIAHSLSMICRYTGHIRDFYSVAQHSLIVKSLVPSKYKLAALLHDAEEAYIGDWSSPLKASLKTLYPGIDDIGERLRVAIFGRFGLDYAQYDDVIHEADDAVYRMERDTFWRGGGAIQPMDQATAMRLFLEQFNDLTGVVV